MANALDGGRGVVRLAADLEVGLRIDEIGNAVAEEGMVIDNEDAVLAGGGVRGSGAEGVHGFSG